MKLSIVIPAYNEEARLPKALSAYAEFFTETLGDDVEIIVVANHCSDGTAAVTRRIAEAYGGVRLIEEPKRVGKGGAVELGMRAATGEYVGFVDADGSTPPDMFFQLVENIGESGCVIGSRWVEGAVVSPRQSPLRRLASRVLNKIVARGIFHLDVRDSQCGAKVFRGEVIREVLKRASEPGWAFDIELLCRVKRMGYAIREFPVEWHHVPGNPTAFLLMSLQMMASVWRVKKSLDSHADRGEGQ